jgi:hypothetical protein
MKRRDPRPATAAPTTEHEVACDGNQVPGAEWAATLLAAGPVKHDRLTGGQTPDQNPQEAANNRRDDQREEPSGEGGRQAGASTLTSGSLNKRPPDPVRQNRLT